MTIKYIKGCIGCGTCVQTCPIDVIRRDAKTEKAFITIISTLNKGVVLGIFAYDAGSEKVSIDEFVDKVSSFAMGTNNPVYTRQMAEDSLARVNELKDWGFFESPLYNKCFTRPLKERDIRVLERIVITHLI